MKPPRQIVVVMTDTQRWDMVGCYGNPALRTPALDALASQGVRFDRAYTCQPVCGPARAGLFTGTWPHGNGGWANSLPLGDNVKTLGQRFRDHGFRCGYVGKWHLDGSDYFGLGRAPDGWDPSLWYDMRNYLEELGPDERRRSRRVESNREGGVTREFTFGHRCSNRAIDFLSKHAGEDFLLVVSYDEPHGPFLCPPEYRRMFEGFEFPVRRNVHDSLEDKPETHRLWAGRRPPAPGEPFRVVFPDYFGCNAFVDSEIGRVLEAVDRHAPGALVVYTSDHGDGLGAHGIWNKGPAMYDEIARIPMIVRWPGQAPAGAVCPHPVSHIDLVPTLLEAAGLPAAKALDGRSMLATVREPTRPARDVVFVEFGRYEVDHDGFGGFQPVRAAFDGRLKLVVNLLSTDELYDLAADPDEMVNRIGDPALAAARDALHDRILAWMNETRDPFRGYYWERRPWRTDARPASWAYTGWTRQRENEEYEPRQLDYSTGLPMVEASRRK
jgi:uncharacterized sulfatase